MLANLCLTASWVSSQNQREMPHQLQMPEVETFTPGFGCVSIWSSCEGRKFTPIDLTTQRKWGGSWFGHILWNTIYSLLSCLQSLYKSKGSPVFFLFKYSTSPTMNFKWCRKRLYEQKISIRIVFKIDFYDMIIGYKEKRDSSFKLLGN